jgi:hypothetical protein
MIIAATKAVRHINRTPVSRTWKAVSSLALYAERHWPASAEISSESSTLGRKPM